jgi:hypothetical protein
MPDPAHCDLCGRPVELHASYVVRMEVFADPAMPPLDTGDLSAGGFDQTLDELLEQMKHLSADDLQDDVHRRFEYRLCPPCHRQFLANPLGKPRGLRVGRDGEN